MKAQRETDLLIQRTAARRLIRTFSSAQGMCEARMGLRICAEEGGRWRCGESALTFQLTQKHAGAEREVSMEGTVAAPVRSCES